MKHLLLFLVSFIPFSDASGQAFNQQKLDSLLDYIHTSKKGMGSLSIFRHGEEVYQKTVGYADLATKKSANEKTVYRIGSISKTFTACIIMQMVEESKLELSTAVSDFFPYLPNAEKITLENLLNHSSGLYNFTDNPDYPSWLSRPQTREDLLDKIVENGSIFSPGDSSAYSNTNYVVLSFIAEEIDGTSFEAILNQRIVVPLGLKHTRFGGKLDTERNEADSYTMLTDWFPASRTDMSIPLGAGSILSTPTDLNTFFTALFTGELVSRSSLKMMKTMNSGFGFGLFSMPFYEKEGFGHTGGIDGFQSIAAYIPEDDVAFAYTGNGVAYPVNDIAIGALTIFYNRKYAFPEFGPKLVLSAEQLQQYTGLYTCPTFPLKIEITRAENTLMAQATGQPSFPLEAYKEHCFRFDAADIKLEFNPEKSSFILRQFGQSFEFFK